MNALWDLARLCHLDFIFNVIIKFIKTIHYSMTSVSFTQDILEVDLLLYID